MSAGKYLLALKSPDLNPSHQPKHLNMKKRIPYLTYLTLLTFLTLATSGCQVLTYTTPAGDRFTRSSLGANTSIQSLAFEAATNGLRRVELRGYENNSSQALGAVTEAAVRAAIQGAK